jgi:hypothetical protein
MENKTEEFLKDILRKSEEESESLSDDGHKSLLEDLKNVLAEAVVGKYHDFHRNGAPAPKLQLVGDLQKIIESTKNGTYDN